MLVASPGGVAPDCLAPLPSAPEDCLGHFQSMHFHGLIGSKYRLGDHVSPALGPYTAAQQMRHMLACGV